MGLAAAASSKEHEFLWTATVEPHAARRKAILAKHGDEVRKLYGYDVSTAVQVRKMDVVRSAGGRATSNAVALPRRAEQSKMGPFPARRCCSVSSPLFAFLFTVTAVAWPRGGAGVLVSRGGAGFDGAKPR